MRSLGTGMSALACGLLIAAWAAPAAAQGAAPAGKEQAELLDVKATALFKKGDVRAALPLYQEAYRAYPNDNSAWNIARCHEELGELHEAITAFRLFQKLPDLSAEDQGAAEEHIQKLEERIQAWRAVLADASQLLGTLGPEAAQPRWNEAVQLPVEPPALLDLAQKLSAAYERAGQLPQARRPFQDLLALEGVSSSVQAKVQRALDDLDQRAQPATPPDPTPEPTPAPAPAARSGVGPLGIAGWSLIGVGVVGVGFGTYQSFAVADVNARIEESVDDNDVTRDDLDALKEEADQAELLQYIGFGVGGAALLGGLVMVLLDEGEAQPAPASAQRWQVGASWDHVSLHLVW